VPETLDTDQSAHDTSGQWSGDTTDDDGASHVQKSEITPNVEELGAQQAAFKLCVIKCF